LVLNYDFPFPKDPENPHDLDAVQVDAIKGVGHVLQRAKETMWLTPEKWGKHGEQLMNHGEKTTQNGKTNEQMEKKQ
jgi:hypothetical protein